MMLSERNQNQPIASNHRKQALSINWLPRLEIKSLTDVWLTLGLTGLQLACICRACIHFKSFQAVSWRPYSQPTAELGLYLLAIVLSIILMPLFILTGLFKVGSYANDNFRFGRDLDMHSIMNKKPKKSTKRKFKKTNGIDQKESLLNKQSDQVTDDQLKEKVPKSGQPFSTSSTISALSTSLTYSLEDGTNPCHHPRRVFSFYQRLGNLLASVKVWKNFMPISRLIHLSIAFMLMFPDVLLVGKEIAYGLRPKGFVHHTQLDFVFMRPLDRFAQSQPFLRHNSDSFNKTNNLYLSNENLKMQLISSSLDDIDQINYSPQMSLELFNLALALALLTLQYSATLWTLNKLYAFVFSLHLAFISILSLLSFAAFEILYKFQVSFADGIKLELSLNQLNSTVPIALSSTTTMATKAVLFTLPFVTDSLSLQLSFLFSLLLILLSALPIYAYGVYQYRMKLTNLHGQFSRYLPGSRARYLASTTSATSDSTTVENLEHEMKPQNIEPLQKTRQQTNCKSDVEYTKVSRANLHVISPSGAMEPSSPTSCVSPPPLPSLPPPTPQPVTNQTASNNNSNAKPKSNTDSDILTCESESLDTDSTISLSAGYYDTNEGHQIIRHSDPLAPYTPYKSHITALLILLTICLNTVFVTYDNICLYQLTADTIPFYSALASISFILWYILLWLVLTFKTNWTFEFGGLFKLNYWSVLSRLAIKNGGETSECSTAISSAGTFKQSRQSSTKMIYRGPRHQQPQPSHQQPLLSGSSTSSNDHTEYAFKLPSNGVQNWSQLNERRNLSAFKVANSLSMTNLNTDRGKSGVFSSSGLLVSNDVVSGFPLKPSGNTYPPEYDSDITPYENFNTIGNVFKARNNNNLGKKQLSVRRINQLAPLLENSTDVNLNQQLFLLRRSLSKSDTSQTQATANKEPTYDLPNNFNSGEVEPNKDQSSYSNFKKIQQIKTSNSNGAKSTESIYNLAKAKANSMMSYTAISELEKRASAIITKANRANIGADISMKQASKPAGLMPLHLAQQQHNMQKKTNDCQNSSTSSSVEVKNSSPKSNSSAISDCISSSDSGSANSASSPTQTDSGRHSMSDSTSSNGPTFLSQPPIYAQHTNHHQLQQKSINSSPMAPTTGTFTSKVSHSHSMGGNSSVTTMSNKPELHLQPDQFIIKKKCARSASRDQLRDIQQHQQNSMVKSSSFCKGALPPTGSGICRSQSGERRHFSSSTALSANKRSTTSINRNCSEL